MSKARLFITAVVVEGQPAAEVAARYRVHRAWVEKLLARYREEGGRRRVRGSVPTSQDLTDRHLSRDREAHVGLRKELVQQALDAGPDTIRWHLQHCHRVTVSRSTVARHLAAQGLVTPEPKKRPRSSYLRFAAEQPNETWQADFTNCRLVTEVDVEVLTWLDDHSGYALSVTAHHRVTGPTVPATFRRTSSTHGVPASTLTDNGMVFTTRLAGGRGGRIAFEHELRQLGVTRRNSRPTPPPATRWSASNRP